MTVTEGAQSGDPEAHRAAADAKPVAAGPTVPFFSPPVHRTVWFPDPTIYVITAWSFNHASRAVPLDDRLLSQRNYAFYFVDAAPREIATFPRKHLLEQEIYPEIVSAGRHHLAEWSFFLMEYKKKVLNYRFYAISSRFYDKNTRLTGTLDHHWDAIFSGLDLYGYGYLPSYDRDFSLIDFVDYIEKGYLGTMPAGLDYVKRLFGVDIPANYRYAADFWCNYIGFASRRHFESYIEFYLPLFEDLFSNDFQNVKEYSEIVDHKTPFRQLKPLSLLLEQISHLFFYKNRVPYFGLHYDGFYEVREWEPAFTRLRPLWP